MGGQLVVDQVRDVQIDQLLPHNAVQHGLHLACMTSNSRRAQATQTMPWGGIPAAISAQIPGFGNAAVLDVENAHGRVCPEKCKTKGP
jgi:hypothetical protein